MPNRILKESICTSEKIANLSDFEYRLWTGLILIADDAGRGDARAAIIKGRVFPLRERVAVKDVEKAVHGLADKGCISLYEIGGKSYFYFPTWSEHQRVRDVKTKYPPPPDKNDENDNSPQSAATCGNLPQTAATRRNLRLESESESEYESENKTLSARAREDVAFEQFWSAYPKKVGKADAIKKFSKAIQKVSLEAILNAVEEQKTCAQWQKDGGQYIPNPSTWLNQERWNDDIKPTGTKTFLDLYYEEGGE